MADGDQKIYTACEEALFRPTITKQYSPPWSATDVLQKEMSGVHLWFQKLKNPQDLFLSHAHFRKLQQRRLAANQFTKLLCDLRDLQIKLPVSVWVCHLCNLRAKCRLFFREVQNTLGTARKEILIGAKLAATCKVLNIHFASWARFGTALALLPSYTINGEKNPMNWKICAGAWTCP